MKFDRGGRGCSVSMTYLIGEHKERKRPVNWPTAAAKERMGKNAPKANHLASAFKQVSPPELTVRLEERIEEASEVQDIAWSRVSAAGMTREEDTATEQTRKNILCKIDSSKGDKKRGETNWKE